MACREIVLDTSEMEAPLPLIEAVRAMDALQEDEVLVFRHRMNPRHLFCEIAARGFAYEIVRDLPNDFEMKIYRKRSGEKEDVSRA